MNTEQRTRLSLIDGSVESVPQSAGTDPKELEPVFEEILVEMLTLEGLETVLQKRIVGFREREQ